MTYECCGTCKYHRTDKRGDWICTNDNSDNFSDYTDYQDDCDDWKERE